MCKTIGSAHVAAGSPQLFVYKYLTLDVCVREGSEGLINDLRMAVMGTSAELSPCLKMIKTNSRRYRSCSSLFSFVFCLSFFSSFSSCLRVQLIFRCDYTSL